MSEKLGDRANVALHGRRRVVANAEIFQHPLSECVIGETSFTDDNNCSRAGRCRFRYSIFAIQQEQTSGRGRAQLPLRLEVDRFPNCRKAALFNRPYVSIRHHGYLGWGRKQEREPNVE